MTLLLIDSSAIIVPQVAVSISLSTVPIYNILRGTPGLATHTGTQK